MRALGVMTVTGLGAVLARVNVNAPFMLVAGFDIAFVCLVLLLLVLGKLKV